MGVASLFVGYIREAWPRLAGDVDEKQRKTEIDALIGENTDRVLQSLPDSDRWPPLCKSMFACPPVNAELITYENRVVHFAASMKNVDFVLRDWFDKFEELLKRLYWEEVYVRVSAGYIGVHEFKWIPKQEWQDALHRGWLKPLTEWDFDTTLSDLETLRENSSP